MGRFLHTNRKAGTRKPALYEKAYNEQFAQKRINKVKNESNLPAKNKQTGLR